MQKPLLQVAADENVNNINDLCLRNMLHDTWTNSIIFIVEDAYGMYGHLDSAFLI